MSGGAFVVATALKAVGFFTLLMLSITATIYLERKVSGFIQDRSGPNRVGPWGVLQVIADGLKFLLKEETHPDEAHPTFFMLAPVLALVPATALFAVIPFAAPLPTSAGLVEMVAADVPVGFLYVLAIASLGVYGVVMGGWASGSKYSFLGGLRGSAQMVSYEVGLALSLVPLVLLTGEIRLPDLVALQQGYGDAGFSFGTWLVVPLLVGFVLFTVAGLAESNRLPFDLPEAEPELIGGYHTEYSAMKFGMFFLGEYAHMITTAGLIVVFFLGGWDIPFWAGDNIRVAADGTVIGEPAVWKTVLTFLAFAVKTGLLVLVFVWIRWTLPRFRYDQLMQLGWKFFIPVATIYVVVTAGAIPGLDAAGVEPGPTYALALGGLNVVLLALLLFVVDRGRVLKGAHHARDREARRTRSDEESPAAEPAAAVEG